MLAIPAANGIECYMISFRRGELIIEELRKFLKEKNIDAGVFTSGIGSFDICNLHAITSTGLPPVDKYYNLEGPVEVGSLGGSVAGGEPHIHVVVSDPPNDKVYVGHLEPGSRCCYRVEVGLIAFKGVKTTRVTDEKTGLIDIVEA
ncbi:PPC domain-containing DNA-binding protein [Marispirochaeta aestuarii]|uniref:PPC domain-containing DNA-binding protein n=1 Tax=Marispirochaeta aestuarii TaxID=1963862 RepID=UPI0029C620A1|nr:PPC domain-containing DNA-binding protein [Marispirochaeta aestuarii]